jgi:LAS superfamily LD-carboxypeptidase LdcB
LQSAAPKRILQAPAPACPHYGSAAVSAIAGNGGKKYSVVKILSAHFAGSADNTMTKPTACAFGRMFDAAKKKGITLKITSGFRTLARQQYFWNCYKTRKCNNGNLAASPGTSNHGTGAALDLSVGATSSATYKWMAANAKTFGFKRTVPSEPWHWEYRP